MSTTMTLTPNVVATSTQNLMFNDIITRRSITIAIESASAPVYVTIDGPPNGPSVGGLDGQAILLTGTSYASITVDKLRAFSTIKAVSAAAATLSITLSNVSPFTGLPILAWHDFKDLTSTSQQILANRVAGSGWTVLQRGSTSTSDVRDSTITLASGGSRAQMAFTSGKYAQYGQGLVGNTYTLIALVKTTTTNNFGVIISTETGYDNGAMLIQTPTGFATRNGSASTATVTVASDLTNDTWRVVGLTAGSGLHKAYERATGFGGLAPSGTPNHGPMRLGCRGWDTLNHFVGDISTVLVFPVELSLAKMNEIADYLLANAYS